MSVKTRPVVKVWCLPKMTEEQLQGLHQDIVGAFATVMPQLVKGEESLIVLFPPDSMEYGLGQEVYVEVSDLDLRPIAGGGDSLAGAHRARLAMELCLCVAKYVEKAKIQCCVREFNECDTCRMLKQPN